MCLKECVIAFSNAWIWTIIWRSEIAAVPMTDETHPRLLPVFSGNLVDQEQDRIAPAKLRAGDLCPQCKQERLDYDGLLNLSCPKCGYAVGGCFT
jgi:hypothetical protein